MQNGSPGSTESKYIYIYIFSGRSRPNRPDIESLISADLAGKYIFWILWAQDTHFAPSNASITHFAASVSLDEVGGNIPIFGKTWDKLQNFRILAENGITSSRFTEAAK